MDDEEFERWSFHNWMPKDHKATSPCDDCLTGFALEMRQTDECDGTPRGYQGDWDPSVPMLNAVRISAVKRGQEKEIRQARAMELLRSGMRNVDVAKTMGLAPSTISMYVAQLRGTR